MQKSTNTTEKKFNPKLKDIEQAQMRLNHLQSQLKAEEINDPRGVLSRKANELESMYEDIRKRMQDKTARGERAINELKKGFFTAWDEFTEAVDQAKRQVQKPNTH